MNKQDVALIIDWENIKYSCTNHLNSLPDIITLKKIARKYGRIVVARAYANWIDDQHKGDMERLALQNVEPVYVITKTFKNQDGSNTIKGSADIKIACDCVELIFKHSDIETYVIASGDGGFSHIVTKLKSYGKRVIPVSIRQTTSALLGAVSEEMVFYDDLVKGIRYGATDKNVRQALDLFVKAVNKIRIDKVNNTLQTVKRYMKEVNPKFEEDAINISSFRHLAYLAEKNNLVRIDSTSEPAAAYNQSEIRSDSGEPLYNGIQWNKLINKLKKNTHYTPLSVINIISNEVKVPENEIKYFYYHALKSQILWFDRTQCYSTLEDSVKQQLDVILNTHHPRVQVYFKG